MARRSPFVPTVASIIVSMLEAAGVDRVFCVSGESYLALLDELGSRDSIDVVTCRHEGGAAMMAVADAKLTGRPGVCMVSRAPGAANASLGVYAAQQDTAPFLLLVGQVEKAHLRRGGFQEADYSKFFDGTAKWTAEIAESTRAVDIMSRAIQVALAGTPGPVVIALPEDVLGQVVESVKLPSLHPQRSMVDQQLLRDIADRLASSQRPLIIAGGALAHPRGRAALLAAAEAWQVPVLCSFRRHDLFPNAHPLFAGELGFFNKPHHVQRFDDSDLILAVGTRLGDLTTHGFIFPQSPKSKQTLIHVHRDPLVIGANYSAEIGLVCESEPFLVGLTRLAPSEPRNRPAWADELRRLRREITTLRSDEGGDGVAFGRVVEALREHIHPDAIVSMDAGISAGMMYRHYDWTPPQILLTPITGAMGWGVPGAVAAALRYPGRQVICMIGDGGMLMGGMELAVAAERSLPITLILANNRSYGAIRVNLEREHPGRRTATDLHNPDFIMLGRAFGCRTFAINSEPEIRPILAEAFSKRSLTLVEIRTSLEVALPKLDTSERGLG
jgi:acetolactate synthase-1/2/3 large subunit